jgi:hypothetical protein
MKQSTTGEKKIKIDAYAVMTQDAWPCVILDKEDNVIGSPVFSNEDGDARQKCKEYIEINFKGANLRNLQIKIRHITITYHAI